MCPRLSEGGDYFIGVHDREIARLAAQHAAWKPETESLWKAAGFGPGQRIADLGCGPGFTALELAAVVGASGSVVAVDKAAHYLDFLGREAARRGIGHLQPIGLDVTRTGSLGAPLDGAFCRFFLAFLIADLDRVLANIHASLVPGGTFAAMEYLTLEAARATPPVRGFDAHTRAWIEFYARHGGDTSIGQYLPSRLEHAGFTVVHRTCVGGTAGPKHRWWTWWGRLMADFSETLVAEGLMTREAVQALEGDWRAAAESRHALIHTPLLLQVVARRER